MNHAQLFHESYLRVEAKAHGALLTTLEQIVIAKCDGNPPLQLSPKDKSVLLSQTLSQLAKACFEESPNPQLLKHLAQSHQTLGLKPLFYELWQETVLETAAEMDETLSEEEKLAWMIAMDTRLRHLKQWRNQEQEAGYGHYCRVFEFWRHGKPGYPWGCLLNRG